MGYGPGEKSEYQSEKQARRDEENIHGRGEVAR
jgi:hypothetical protein